MRRRDGEFENLLPGEILKVVGEGGTEAEEKQADL